MFTRAIVGAVLAVCLSTSAFANITIDATPVNFGGTDWVVNKIFVDTQGNALTNFGLLVQADAGSIYQEHSPLFGEPAVGDVESSGSPLADAAGSIVSRPVGKTGFDMARTPPGPYSEINDYATLKYDTYVQIGNNDPGVLAGIAGKSGVPGGSNANASQGLFDNDTLDIHLLVTSGGGNGSEVEIAQVTIKSTSGGTASLQIFAGSAGNIAESQFDIVAGEIGGTPAPPVVPVPAAALLGLPLLGLVGVVRRRMIG